MSADPGQQKDVAKEHSKTVARLRDEYERWWADISKRFDEYCEIVIGADQEDPTLLTCHDWHGERALSLQDYVKKRDIANGFWAIEVARPGRYAITLRQQPAAAKFPIQADEARLRVGKSDRRQAVPARATSVTFEVTLDIGSTRLQTWLIEKSGVTHGAYFVEVKRLP
jgi:uncharacterized sulfatase